MADTRTEPGDKPIAYGQGTGAFKTEIGSFLFPREQHISPGQPNVRRITSFFETGIGEGEGRIEISQPSQRDAFGREQFRSGGKTFQRLIGPDLGLTKFPQLN